MAHHNYRHFQFKIIHDEVLWRNLKKKFSKQKDKNGLTITRTFYCSVKSPISKTPTIYNVSRYRSLWKRKWMSSYTKFLSLVAVPKGRKKIRINTLMWLYNGIRIEKHLFALVLPNARVLSSSPSNSYLSLCEWKKKSCKKSSIRTTELLKPFVSMILWIFKNSRGNDSLDKAQNTRHAKNTNKWKKIMEKKGATK